MADSYIPVAVQRLVLTESKGFCEYCWLPPNFSSSSFQFDHILPTSKGGLSIFRNLARSCAGCNGGKQDKTHHFDPLTHQFYRLYNPREDKWAEHFQWIEDDMIIEGITGIGRATVQLLQLNCDGVVNLRQLLKIVGLHPPF